MREEGEFDRLKNAMVFDHTWFTTVNAFIEEGTIKDSDWILDAGCGWGRVISGLKFFKPGSVVIGVDANFVRLSAGKKILADLGLDRKVVLEVGDVDHLGFPDGTFDVVVCARLLQYVPDPERSVGELCRVLKPGGRLVLTVPNKLNPVRFCTYTRKLYSTVSVKKWLLGNQLENVSSRTIGFLPGGKRKRLQWTSKWLLMEKAQRIPLFCYLGGLVLASGRKPTDGN
ncbi:MAG TPA: class I SAM-dependent methyltransferase [Candidatus Binatia bacterium]|nr:class I SAM-dependent methyltransferase [Candidatus Binatia bacterium]